MHSGARFIAQAPHRVRSGCPQAERSFSGIDYGAATCAAARAPAGIKTLFAGSGRGIEPSLHLPAPPIELFIRRPLLTNLHMIFHGMFLVACSCPSPRAQKGNITILLTSLSFPSMGTADC